MSRLTEIEAMIARIALGDRDAFGALYDATSADGVNAGNATADQAGGMLTDVDVTVTRTTTEATATVTATTPGLLPGVNTTVSKTITGPIERWVP